MQGVFWAKRVASAKALGREGVCLLEEQGRGHCVWSRQIRVKVGGAEVREEAKEGGARSQEVSWAKMRTRAFTWNEIKSY